MLASLFARVPWLPYVLPLAVFLVVTSVEPSAGAENPWLPLTVEHYPLVYAVKIALVALAVALCWPEYMKFPRAITPLGILVGLVGAGLWIGLCEADFEEQFMPWIGLGWWLQAGERSAYDPFAALADQPAWLYGFLALRFVGLALLVPILEEFFLRGFVMRFLTANDWQRVRVEDVSSLGIIGGIAMGVLMHPGSEFLAAFVWFSLVTWLMLRTRSIWDCVAAHAVTNLVLGIYVIAFDRWELW